jgi:hypothetical protein
MLNTGSWALVFAGTFWYAAQVRHSSRTSLEAFLLFCAILGGITLPGLLGVVAFVYVLGVENEIAAAKALGPFLALAVVIPAFLHARERIKRPRPSRWARRRLFSRSSIGPAFSFHNFRPRYLPGRQAGDRSTGR